MQTSSEFTFVCKLAIKQLECNVYMMVSGSKILPHPPSPPLAPSPFPYQPLRKLGLWRKLFCLSSSKIYSFISKEAILFHKPSCKHQMICNSSNDIFTFNVSDQILHWRNEKTSLGSLWRCLLYIWMLESHVTYRVGAASLIIWVVKTSFFRLLT